MEKKKELTKELKAKAEKELAKRNKNKDKEVKK